MSRPDPISSLPMYYRGLGNRRRLPGVRISGTSVKALSRGGDRNLSAGALYGLWVVGHRYDRCVRGEAVF